MWSKECFDNDAAKLQYTHCTFIKYRINSCLMFFFSTKHLMTLNIFYMNKIFDISKCLS